MTKGLTSAAALMLCEEGKLSLDDPIDLYFPELKEQKSRRMTTVRDLLSKGSVTFAKTPWISCEPASFRRAFPALALVSNCGTARALAWGSACDMLTMIAGTKML